MRAIASTILALALLAAPAASEAETLSNGTPISIPALGAGSPYPSTVQVDGVRGRLAEVQVYLMGITHPTADQIDVLLAGPEGQRTILMSDACSTEGFNSKIFFFADISPFALTPGICVTGHGYKPSDTDTGPDDVFGPPAPPGPYPAAMSVFNGTDPNGPWSLFVTDDEAGGAGQIEQGWLLNLTVEPHRCGGRDATIAGTDGADALRGTRGRDVVAGLGGADVIRGLAGADLLCGGAGPDRLIGGRGGDRLIGGPGQDILRGGPGRDRERQR
jgi:hypothetical protein